MPPIPSPPYEWDEDKREQTLRLRGLDFTLVSQIDWSTATYRRQEQHGEVRYTSLGLIGDRLHHVVWRPTHKNNQHEKSQPQGDNAI